MSAVVELVSDAFEAVGDAVGAVAEGIGDAVEWVVEKVVEPVVKAVDNTIQAAMDDPLGTIAKVATAIYAPYLLPAVNFGVAVANGVPVEKALGNAALSYVGGQIGAQVGNYASQAFELGDVATTVVTAGAKGAAGAGLRGDNIFEGAINGAVNSGLSIGANSLYRDAYTSAGADDRLDTSHFEQGYFAPGGAGYYDSELYDSIAPTSDSLGPSPSNDQILSDIGYYGDDQTSGLDITPDSLGPSPSNDQILRDIGYYDASSGGLPSDEVNDMGEVVITGDRPNPVYDYGEPSSSDDVSDMGEMVMTASRPNPEYDISGVGEVYTNYFDELGNEFAPDGTPIFDNDSREPNVVEEDGVVKKDDKVSTIKIPKIDLFKDDAPRPAPKTPSALDSLGCDAIPWLDTRDSMLKNQIVFDKGDPKAQAQLENIYGRMDSDPTKEIPRLKEFGDQNRGGLPGIQPFSGGGSACNPTTGVMYCYNNDAKYMPKFVNCGPEVLTNSGSSRRQPIKHKELGHLQPRISSMGNMGGMASGGLPKVYQENMPEGHKPEFVTGMTGYYACGGGTGQSDDIPAMLHDGDYVMDADVVAALGDGSSKAGREVLEGFRSQIRHDDAPKGKPVAAKIADGEYVFPAGFVAALGGGDEKEGAKILDGLREKLRAHKRSAPTSKIPPKALSPLDYIKRAQSAKKP